jgi:hypothetical protein
MATAEQKKRAERYFVEHVQKYYPGFLPVSAAQESEEPDFLFTSPDGVVGLEVTQLFHTSTPGLFTELQVAQFHRDIVVRAGEIYTNRKLGPEVDVTTYYDRDVQLSDLNKCAVALAEFVAASPYGTTGPTTTSPTGLSVMAKHAAMKAGAPKWHCSGNSETQLLTPDFWLPSSQRRMRSFRSTGGRRPRPGCCWCRRSRRWRVLSPHRPTCPDGASPSTSTACYCSCRTPAKSTT